MYVYVLSIFHAWFSGEKYFHQYKNPLSVVNEILCFLAK